MFKIGDIVTRKKYNNDIDFEIYKIDKKNIYLRGIDIRLYADASIESNDLIHSSKDKKKEKIEERIINNNEYFLMPGTVLHIDSDNNYLEKCNNYYKKNHIKYYSYIYKESEYKNIIKALLLKHKPNILVVTGHDAFNKNNKKYKNSNFFIECVAEIRKIIPSHDELIIIAGACQSDYLGLIKCGATYASSPKGINIHALDPAIVAAELALSDKNKIINIKEILSKTKCGEFGIGGIITTGKMLMAYPRKEII